MKTVYKYQLSYDDKITLDLPKGAKPLHLGMQGPIGRVPHVWVLVDPEAPTEPMEFRFCGTGHPIEDAPAGHRWEHVGSVLEGIFVWHLFYAKQWSILRSEKKA